MSAGSSKVPFFDLKRETASIREELEAASRRVIESGWFVLGREGKAFEEELARLEGRKHALGLGNGLDAIRLALQAAGVGPGDEVIVPAMTFVATALAVLQCGASVVLADVDEATLLLDPAEVARVRTPRTKAVVPVHLYGQIADVPAIRAAAGPNVIVVEDAAQAHGARRGGVAAGHGSAAATYSFYPSKNLGALGDGGALTTDDDALAAAVGRLRNYGQAEKYLHVEVGLNSRLDELQAAFLRVRLARLAADNGTRAAVASRYHAELGDLPGLRLLGVPPGSAPVWHLYPVRHARRDELAARLGDAGVETLVHYPRALHQQPALAHLADGKFPVAERAARELLSLPMGTTLREEEIARVVEATRRACHELAG